MAGILSRIFLLIVLLSSAFTSFLPIGFNASTLRIPQGFEAVEPQHNIETSETTQEVAQPTQEVAQPTQEVAQPTQEVAQATQEVVQTTQM
ncbi:hypothetical protein EB796_011382 [Bugula neritina]|uniref:Uncharacterized protein n=1 Tax=Bugula neritina TaxID=10212 RepID=A0A7J7JVA0_BUGNE|nr:hypothetical protein EB796_011382 [Bugula neritina]